MDLLLVNLAGAALIAWIVWYFFLSRTAEERVAVGGPHAQDVQVTVKGGYIPELIRARPGVPLRIHFRREETSACSEEVVFPDFGIRRSLPAFETTTIELPAAPAGSYGFACGMDMMHGRLVLEERPSPAPEAVDPRPATDARAAWPVDPICGMKVDPARPAATTERDGRTSYFCSVGCKTRFEQGAPPGPMEQRITLGVRRKT
jgi:Cu+-exporting ATPase